MFSWGRNKHRLEVQRCSLDRSVSPKMMELQGIMFARYFRRSFASTLDGFLWEVYRTLVKGITGSSFSCAFCLSCQPGFPTIVATPQTRHIHTQDCGYVFTKGPQAWAALPDNYRCPPCGAPKFRFQKVPKGSAKGEVKVKKSWF